MAMSMAYALLFGGLRLLDAPPRGFLLISVFVTWVGLAQAALYGGKRPRLASLWAGGVVGLGTSVLFMINNLRREPMVLRDPTVLLFLALLGFPYWITLWIFLAYVAGAFVAGVLLIADNIRLRFQRQPAPR